MTTMLLLALTAAAVAALAGAAFLWSRRPNLTLIPDSEGVEERQKQRTDGADTLTRAGAAMAQRLPARMLDAAEQDPELTARLRHAGSSVTPATWLGMRVVTLIASLAVTGFAVAAMGLSGLSAIGFAALAGTLGWMLPASRLKGHARKRRDAVTKGMPGLLQSILMGLTVGETIPLAFAKSVAATPAGPFRDELERMLAQERAGANLAELFWGLYEQTGHKDARALSQSITLATNSGADITPVIARYIRSASKRAGERVDKKAQALGTKLMLPSVGGLFIAGGILFGYPMISDILGSLA